MKTISIIIPNGWAIKGFILTDTINVLSKKMNVVILSPLSNEDSFRSLFVGKNIYFEQYNIPKMTNLYEEIDKLLFWCHEYRTKRKHATKLYKRQREWFYEARPRKSLLTFIKFKLIRPLEALFAKYFFFLITLNIEILIEKFFYKKLTTESNRLKKVYQKYNVSLAMSTQPLIVYFDRAGIWAAEELGIPSICYLMAWDNLSTKGRIPFNCKYYFVWSEWMKKELLISHKHILPEQVIITGAHILDFYKKEELRLCKEDFFEMLDLDITRPLVLFAPPPPSTSPALPQMLDQIFNEFETGSISNNPQLLLRLHPIGGIGPYKHMLQKYPNIKYTDSSMDNKSLGTLWMPTMEDMTLMVNSVLHCDLMVNVSSTMTLEAFMVDKPVINIAYDYDKGSYPETLIRNALTFRSYSPVVKTKSTKIAYDFDLLIKFIESYLNEPEQDKKNRSELLELICGNTKLDSSTVTALKIIELFET